VAGQFVDPAVSRAKFSRELREYRALAAEYRGRGWFLLEASWPTVLVLLAAPQIRPPALVAAVRFDYTNYDSAPPSVQLLNPFTLEPYRQHELPTQMPRAVGVAPQVQGLPPGMVVGQMQQPLLIAHGPNDIPFLCIAGVREYHEHPAHTGDAWELHRADGAGRLVRILEIISKYGVQPINGYAVQLLPQVAGFSFGAAPE
jgi:Predicted metal binding domain